MRVTYEQVRSGYTASKAEQERRDLMFRWFARPLSFPVAYLFLRLGWTPNDVTVVSLGGNVVGLGLISSGNPFLMVVGVAVLHVALIFDAADGNMARATQSFSPLGEWLEGVGAYILYACFHFVGGIGAYRSLGGASPVVATGVIPAPLLIVAGGVASISITLAVMFAAKFSIAFPDIDREQLVAKRGTGAYGALFTVGRNLSFPSGLVLPATLVGLLLRRYELVLLFFAALNAGMLVAVSARCTLLASRSLHRAE